MLTKELHNQLGHEVRTRFQSNMAISVLTEIEVQKIASRLHQVQM